VNEFVLNGLVKRRAELAGDIERTHEALRKMVLDLESLDATNRFQAQGPVIVRNRARIHDLVRNTPIATVALQLFDPLL
jgi:hypothetical protein